MWPHASAFNIDLLISQAFQVQANGRFVICQAAMRRKCTASKWQLSWQ